MQCPCLRHTDNLPLTHALELALQALPSRAEAGHDNLQHCKEAVSLWPIPSLQVQNSLWDRPCKREGAEASSACPAPGQGIGYD